MTKPAALQGITARVIDVTSGAAAAGIPVRLERHQAGKWHPCGIAITSEKGHAHLLDGEDEDEEILEKGDYRLTFEVAAYFKARGVKTMLPFVQIVFSVEQNKHHHFPLTLGPFGFSIHGEV